MCPRIHVRGGGIREFLLCRAHGLTEIKEYFIVFGH